MHQNPDTAEQRGHGHRAARGLGPIRELARGLAEDQDQKPDRDGESNQAGLDQQLQRKAEVVVLNGFSSHADRNDLLALLGPLVGQTAKMRLVHGDPDQSEALAQALREKGIADVAIPEPGDTVTLP